MIITTARLGHFFTEVGRPGELGLAPPTADDVARFVQIAQRYGYRLGTEEDNLAVGITLPPLSGRPSERTDQHALARDCLRNGPRRRRPGSPNIDNLIYIKMNLDDRHTYT
ncbi:MAG: hypothetical protein QOF66_2500 [Mycobacterium sp.]|nr:cupin [Mycobacterium sp.]MDT5054134.1 hypothetical protein [Mycobacterium sp.]